MSRNVSVGLLRHLGAEIPDRVPDCATFDISKVDFEGASIDHDVLKVKLAITAASPMRWESYKVELEDGTIIECVWPPSDEEDSDD